MNYALLIPAVWAVLGVLTWVSWYSHKKKYPPIELIVPMSADPSDIYLKHEPYNRYNNTQYN